MIWETTYEYINQYKYTGKNQHGDRYKFVGTKRVRAVTMSTKTSNEDNIQTLIILSDRLNIPIHYDFKENIASIKVMSADAVMEAIK